MEQRGGVAGGRGTISTANKDAEYFLPSENEWYKAAYYNPAGSDYFLYPTASDTAPTAVASGTDAGTAVFAQSEAQGPAGVDFSGALSSYGTMGQGGNVWEWNESALAGTNSSSSESRAVRGGRWSDGAPNLLSSTRIGFVPTDELSTIGFRVASVEAAPIPEPGTWAAAALLAGGAAFVRWRRRKATL